MMKSKFDYNCATTAVSVVYCEGIRNLFSVREDCRISIGTAQQNEFFSQIMNSPWWHLHSRTAQISTLRKKARDIHRHTCESHHPGPTHAYTLSEHPIFFLNPRSTTNPIFTNA